MRKNEILEKLNANHYFYKEEESFILISLARNYCLVIEMNNDTIANYKDFFRWNLFLSTRKISLKNITSGNRHSIKGRLHAAIIGTLVFLLFSILYNYFIDEVSIFKLNVFFLMAMGYLVAEIIYLSFFFKRLSKIKKLLNLK